MPALTVHNAEIRTATVEVKTLTLAGKQVTQSVFKQLQDRDLIADDGRLNGQPWGRVNYHPEKCSADVAHLHVVWQVGADLFRSRVDMHKAWPSMFEAKNGLRYLEAKVRDACRVGIDVQYLRNSVLVENIQGVKVRIDPSPEIGTAVFRRRQLDELYALMKRLGPDTRTDYLASRGRGRPDTVIVSTSAAVRAAWFDLDAALDELEADPLVMLESYLHEEVRVEADLRRRHREVRQALADLPQLFIAV
jgi:hypothetical protein